MTMIDTLQNTMKRRRRMAREPMELGGGVAEATASKPSTPVVERQGTKSALLLSLLSRSVGATIAQIVEATGWLPHTARAALTGLKKKGHRIASEKPEGGERVYRIIVPILAATGAAAA
jgi:Protein of unknown function (DUF3489)